MAQTETGVLGPPPSPAVAAADKDIVGDIAQATERQVVTLRCLWS
jgi:hypothetical protein